jgi:WD40 repeat protein
VEQIQDQFKKTKMMMSMVLASFSLEAVYHLPYAVKNPYNLEKEDKYALGLTMEGDDIFENYEDLMEDEKRLKKLIKEENIKTFDFNDPRLFKAAYPKGAVYSSEFKTGLFSPSAKNYFDYQQEVEKISPKVPVLEIPEEPEPKVYKSPPKKYKYKFNDVKTKEQLVTIYKNKVAYFDEFNESIYVRKVLSRNRLAEFDVELAFQKPVILKWDPEGEKLALGVDYDIRKREGQSVLRIYYAGNKKPIGRIRTYNELQDFQWISNSKFAYGLVNNSIVFGKINGDTMVNTDTISVLSSERQTSKNIRIKLDLMKGEEDATLVSYDNLSGKIKLWNLSTHETTGSIPVNEASVASDLEVSPNPKYVAVLFKNRIEVFVNGKPYKTITDVQKSLKRISWNPDGSYLAYIDKDHNIVYQKMGSGSKKVVLEGSGQKFSPAEMIELHDKGHWAVSGNKSYDNRFYPLELHYR